MNNVQNKNIEIFKSEDGKLSFEVNLDGETVWLNRHQISSLFDRDVKTIGKHISKVFKEKELSKSSTVALFATVQYEGGRAIKRDIEYYNLDVIISVGYRVKSKRGTQFRQWALSVLKQHLIDGYSINEKRLIERKIELEVKESVDIMSGIFMTKGIKDSNETKEIIENVSIYIGKSIKDS